MFNQLKDLIVDKLLSHKHDRSDDDLKQLENKIYSNKKKHMHQFRKTQLKTNNKTLYIRDTNSEYIKSFLHSKPTSLNTSFFTFPLNSIPIKDTEVNLTSEYKQQFDDLKNLMKVHDYNELRGLDLDFYIKYIIFYI